MCDKCEYIGDYNCVELGNIAFFRSRSNPNGGFCIKAIAECEYCGDACGDDVLITHCPWCGKEITIDDRA